MDSFVGDFVSLLHALPILVVTLIMIAVVFSAQLVMGRLFGLMGLATWIVLSIVIANLQVLKVVQAEFLPAPVALGTVMFASTYLCTDLINETYGANQARKVVLLGFAAYFAWTLIAILTLGYRPLSPQEAGDGYGWALGMHDALASVLTPAPTFFIAGMIAYLVSQNLDIFIFNKIRGQTGEKMLWLRNTASTIVSAFVDSAIFSLLAFWLFASDPVPFNNLVMTYIIGTWMLRVAMSVIDTPFMYFGRRALSSQN